VFKNQNIDNLKYYKKLVEFILFLMVVFFFSDLRKENTDFEDEN